jgi:hypothetical protein
VERQAALRVARPELGGTGLARDDDRQVDEVVRVPQRDDRPAASRIVFSTPDGTSSLRISFGWNGRTTLPSGPTTSWTSCG